MEANVNNLVNELRDFKTEMRQQNEMRAEEIRELRQRQDEMQARHDKDIKKIYEKFDATDKKIDDKFDKLSEQLHTMTIAAVVGFGAIAVAMTGVIFAAFK